MRKPVLFLVLASMLLPFGMRAQLFSVSDTVCVDQDVIITNNNPNAGSTYYWSFCSGYLLNVPIGTDMGIGFGFNAPSSIEIAKDAGNYYAFVTNRATNELLRLDFGSTLTNTPTVTNFGNLINTLPDEPNSMDLVQDNGNWFLFVSGGTTAGNSSLARIDFGSSLANIPFSVNFGNLGGLLLNPRGIIVEKEGANYFGFLVNYANGKLIRLNFGTNISLTPALTDLTNFGFLLGPSDIDIALDATNNWHLFITDEISSNLTQVEFGTSLGNPPLPLAPNTVGGTLNGPSSIRLVQDCGMTYAYITDRASNELTRVDMPNYSGIYTGANLGGISAGFNQPSDISPVVREGGDLYGYVVNAAGNNLSRITYSQCTNSTIASANTAIPPVYTYDAPGLYNVYLIVDEGMPTAQVECHQIRALTKPKITASNDTLICQGDTVRLGVAALFLDSVSWAPVYNITDSFGVNVGVYPNYSLDYIASLYFGGGCIVDTPIHVEVSKVMADAGPDRTLNDGAYTVLGGAYTSSGPGFSYFWTPAINVNNVFLPNPTARPENDITYYLEVTNSMGCKDIDTVIVYVNCNNINLPNAFVPESGFSGSNRFGILNNQIVKLNYLRIFDRWGKMVFETTDMDVAWDGKVNGGEIGAAGVYVWVADGFCLKGQHFQTSGNVTLIR